MRSRRITKEQEEFTVLRAMLIIQSLFGLKSRHTLVRDTYRKDMRSTHPEGGQPPSIHRSSIYSYSIAAQQRKRGAAEKARHSTTKYASSV
jgi:hypothetical protein